MSAQSLASWPTRLATQIAETSITQHALHLATALILLDEEGFLHQAQYGAARKRLSVKCDAILEDKMELLLVLSSFSTTPSSPCVYATVLPRHRGCTSDP